VVIARQASPCQAGRDRLATAVPTLGADAGTFVVPEDFDAPLPAEVLDEFEAAAADEAAG